MLIKLTCILLSSQALACSDCFSKCHKSNKNECLVDCGCPFFGPSSVHGGSFLGSSGQIYVPDVDHRTAEWLARESGCDLPCSSKCSSNYIDLQLETCVKKCGCSNLLSETSFESSSSVQSKCETLCRGSRAGCAVDCYSHIEENQDLYYLWIGVPIMGVIFVLAWMVIRQKKEDDYVLI